MSIKIHDWEIITNSKRFIIQSPTKLLAILSFKQNHLKEFASSGKLTIKRNRKTK
jgi:hypothetical protein